MANPDENARMAAMTALAGDDGWHQDIADGVAALAQARDAAQDALSSAQTASQTVSGDLAAANVLVSQAAALATSGSTSEVRQLAEGIRQLAAWRVQVDNQLIALWNLQAAICRNAVMTDNALIYLANLAQRQ